MSGFVQVAGGVLSGGAYTPRANQVMEEERRAKSLSEEQSANALASADAADRSARIAAAAKKASDEQASIDSANALRLRGLRSKAWYMNQAGEGNLSEKTLLGG